MCFSNKIITLTQMAMNIDPSGLEWDQPTEKRFSFFTIISEETGLRSRIAYDSLTKCWIDARDAVGSIEASTAHVVVPDTTLLVPPSTHLLKVKGKKMVLVPEKSAELKGTFGTGVGVIETPKDRVMKTSKERLIPSPPTQEAPKRNARSQMKKMTQVSLPKPVRTTQGKPGTGGKRVLSQLFRAGKANQRVQKDSQICKDFTQRCEKKGYNDHFLSWNTKGPLSSWLPPYPFSNYISFQEKENRKAFSKFHALALKQNPSLTEEESRSSAQRDPTTKWMVTESYKNRLRDLHPRVKEEISLFFPEVLRTRSHISLNDLIEAQNNVLSFFDHCFFMKTSLLADPLVISVASGYFEASIANRDRAIGWFKSYIEILKRTISGPEDSYKEHLDSYLSEQGAGENIFLTLLNHSFWAMLPRVKQRTHLLERVCGSLTARSMAKPSRLQEDIAYKKFLSIIKRESPCQVDLTKITRAARTLGRSCKNLPPVPEEPFRVDLGTTACLEFTHKDGGRTAFFRDEFLPWIKTSPGEDEIVLTPHGVKTLNGGIPRFRSLIPPDQEPPEGEFDDTSPSLIMESCWLSNFQFEGMCKQGFGPNIGYQLLTYCTTLFSRSMRPSQVHASPVLESGGKTRWITIMSMLDSVVQDYARSKFTPLLTRHPDIKPIFTKTNLAWQLLNKLPPADLTHHALAYVSDYSNATDAIDHRLARALLEGFADGAGLSLDEISKLGIESLCSPKLLIHRRDRNKEGRDEILTKSGVFMGEPLSKVTLTILMYVLPLLVLAEHGEDPENPPSWYYYYAPGDDHLATGPDWFLEGLAAYSEQLGMLLNREKTYQSTFLVPLCEQWIYVPNLGNRITTIDAASSMDSYLRSPWVETLKLKLFAPYCVSEKFYHVEDYSVLGRAISLSRCLGGLQPTWSEFERTQFRDYFILRYVDQLPPRSWWQYHFAFLRTQLGGLGLSINEVEERRHWDSIPIGIRRCFSTCFSSMSPELYMRLNRLHFPQAILGYYVSDLEDASVSLAQQAVDGHDAYYGKREWFHQTFGEVQDKYKSLLFDYALSQERLSAYQRGTSQRYETRLRNIFASTCDLKKIPDEKRIDFLLVASDAEKSDLMSLFGTPQSERVVALEELRRTTFTYSPSQGPLPHFNLIKEVEKYLPLYDIRRIESLQNVRRNSVFLGINPKILCGMPT